MESRLAEIDRELISLQDDMQSDAATADGTLHCLLKVSAELETMLAQTSVGFGATRAYAQLVDCFDAPCAEFDVLWNDVFPDCACGKFSPKTQVFAGFRLSPLNIRRFLS